MIGFLPSIIRISLFKVILAFGISGITGNCLGISGAGGAGGTGGCATVVSGALGVDVLPPPPPPPPPPPLLCGAVTVSVMLQ